ncbi:MAG: DUF4091 domain-containing protein [bacterium]|nr:DUF4091 domain-containing protein [bacterium]
MESRNFAGWFGCAVILLCMSAAGFCEGAEKDFLLTENGVNNIAGSEYKNAPVLKTGGDYYVMPEFAPLFALEYNEKGTVTAPTPFTSGILCNGDASFNYKRTPFPYAFWTDRSLASLILDLKKQYFISKVRVKILLAPKVHGISRIGVYTWDEMLDAGSQPLKEIELPVNGWNEFSINKASDKIKLDFTAMSGCRYMTISEVEIRGKESSQATNKSDTLKKDTPQAKSDGVKNYFAFDFGTVDSPVWNDFVPVSEKTVYTKEKGYGWIPFANEKPLLESYYGTGSAVVPGLLSRDRGKEVKVYDNLFSDFNGAQQAYHSRLEQEFAVDIRNGRYLLYLCSGDLVYAKPGNIYELVVDAEGKRAISGGIRYDYDLCSRAQFEVDVKDGQLNLRFGCGGEEWLRNWNVCGMLILPCNNRVEKASAQETITELEKEITVARENAFSALFREVKYEETTKLFPLAKSDTDRGYILFVRNWMKAIFPDTVPQKAEAEIDELSIWCSPGEYEPVTLGVYPLANLAAEVEASDLVSREKNVIEKKNISIRVTGYLPERIKDERKTVGDYTCYLADSSWGTSYMKKFPKILWPYTGKIDINETKQLWLTVHVPKAAKPGKYEGRVIFKPLNKPQQVIPLSVTVFPINLLKSDRVQGMYWYAGMTETSQDRQRELLDMAEHGIGSVVIWQVLPELKTEEGKLTLDFTLLDKLVREIKDAGLTQYIPFYTASLVGKLKYLCKTGAVNMSLDDAYSYTIGEINKHAQENKWPQVLFYPVDEIGNSANCRAEFKHLASLIKKEPGAKVYCTVNNYAAGVDCADTIDYWCANIRMSQEQEQDVIKRGKVLMRYGNSFNFNPRISRTVSGFGFWRIPAEAMYYWHYQATNGDPFTALDTKSRDWVSSYPSPDGPINSIDFEAIREGIDDMNYIYTLRMFMDKAKKSGKEELAKGGETILKEIISCDPSYSQYDFAGVPNEKYHEWRLRMAQEIMKLQAAF